MTTITPSVRTIGILGGGQLGRMLSVAASRLGIETHVFSPEAEPVAGHVAHRVTTAEFTDETALTEFATSVDLVTFEFENIPDAALAVVERHTEVLPRRNALVVSQDRLVEKDFLNDLGLATAPYAAVATRAELDAALAEIGVPAILKTRRLGYDGKGQVRLSDMADADRAWDQLSDSPCILEGVVEFACEISVVVARSRAGDAVAFEPGENVHREGILRTTTIPSGISDSERAKAVSIGTSIVDALDYVGVAAAELFVVDRDLLVNEIAPRVHNSGHWTLDGCVIDQFEQHVRAVAGWPLGDGGRHSDVVMTNLIGDEVLDLDALARDSSVALHVYGKEEVRPGRKMGHFNRLSAIRRADPARGL